MVCFDPSDVIFIINKWDAIIRDESDSEEEDEETRIWENILFEIKACWPSVKEENIYKMNLKEVYIITYNVLLSFSATSKSTYIFHLFCEFVFCNYDKLIGVSF